MWQGHLDVRDPRSLRQPTWGRGLHTLGQPLGVGWRGLPNRSLEQDPRCLGALVGPVPTGPLRAASRARGKGSRVAGWGSSPSSFSTLGTEVSLICPQLPTPLAILGRHGPASPKWPG